MDWEAHFGAAVMCAAGGDTLNVGFGMGIIDGYVVESERRARGRHHHRGAPGRSRMLRQGWGSKPWGRRGVRPVAGGVGRIISRRSLPDGEKRLPDVCAPVRTTRPARVHTRSFRRSYRPGGVHVL